MALSILLVSADAFSQVVIRERITVSPRSHATTATMQSLPLVYVARDSGTLAGTISLARKYTALTPGRLSITLHDTTIEIETREYLNTFITWCEELFDVCNGYIVIPYPASYGYSLRAPCILRFFLRDIHAGDTLGFVYHGFYELPVTRVSGDDVTLSIADSPCYVYWEGELQNLEECVVHLAYPSPEVGGFLVSAKEDTLRTGQETFLDVIAINADSEEVPLDTTALVTYRLKPEVLGKFIDASGDTVPSPLTSVRYGDARRGSIRFVSTVPSPDSTIRGPIEVLLASDTTRRGSDTIVVSPYEILLGESKYYRAEERDGRLIIVEESAPNAGNGIPGVWGDTPLAVVEGGKLGVYWEKRSANGEVLDSRLIRVIGRYWEKDLDYRVRLTAAAGTKTATIRIKVIPPKALGTAHPTMVDVWDSTINLDSLIVLYDGKEGVPPQIIKGIIDRETGSKFRPEKRYEPFQDYSRQILKDHGPVVRSSPYWVDASHLNGDPPPPTGHHFYQWGSSQRSYMPAYEGSIADVWEAHWDPEYELRLYKSVEKRWQREFVRAIRDSILKADKSRDTAAVESRAFSMATDRCPQYIREKYDNGALSRTPAQMRIGSSFGIMQPVYYDIFSDDGYKNPGALPELLMLGDTNLCYGTKHLVSRFSIWKKIVKQNFTSSSCWANGWEGTFKVALTCYNSWNPTLSYGIDVLSRATKFPPRKER